MAPQSQRPSRRAFIALSAGVAVSSLMGAGPAEAAPLNKNFWKGSRMVRAVYPESFGATGDGVSDDTAALQRSLDAVAPGQALVLSRGRTYRHSDVLRAGVPGSRINGGGTLLATREDRSMVFLDADRISIDDVTLAVLSTSRRWTAYEQMKLRLGRHTGLAVSNVTIDGSAAAGIYVGGADHFTITDVTLRGTRADGIHMTEGAGHGTVTRPRVYNPGDDAVAVVSYDRDAGVSHHITVHSPRLYGQTWGRGFTVIGGEDITYNDVYAEGSAGAAVTVASEGAPWFTRSSRRVTVHGGTLVRSNTHPGIGHGAILVHNENPQRAVEDVRLADLTVRDTSTVSGRDCGIIAENGATISGVELSNLSFHNGNAVAVWRNTRVSGLVTAGLSQNGARVTAV